MKISILSYSRSPFHKLPICSFSSFIFVPSDVTDRRIMFFLWLKREIQCNIVFFSFLLLK